MSQRTLDVASIRKEFPILSREIDGQPLVYLDSANTSQKPRAVIDAMVRCMEHSYAPINRSAYRLAAEATDAYEGARSKVRRFINAPPSAFTRKTSAAEPSTTIWSGSARIPIIRSCTTMRGMTSCIPPVQKRRMKPKLLSGRASRVSPGAGKNHKREVI